MKSPSKTASLLDVLGNRNFRLLWIGSTITMIGDALTIVATPLLVFALTDSVTNLTLAFMIEALPWILIGPIAGVMVDRVSRRAVLLLVDLIRAFLVLGIFLSSDVTLIYILLFLSQVLAAVSAPARSAVIPELIEKELYVKSIGLMQSTFQTVQIVGAFAAAGVMTLFGGPRASFLVDMATFLAAFFLTLLIRFPKEGDRASGGQKGPSFLQSFREGAGYLFRHRVLRYITGINLIKAVTQALVLISSVLYVKTELHLPAAEGDRLYSLVVAAIAGGIVAGTAVISAFDRKWDRRYLITGGLLLQGTAFLMILFQPGPSAVVALFFLAGLGASGALTPVSAYYAESTPNEIRGRVYSVVNSLIKVALLIGFWLWGLVGEQFGAVVLIASGGIFLLVSVPLLTILLRGFRVLGGESVVRPATPVKNAQS